MTSSHKLALIVGFIFIFHAAYSAAQHRSYLRITQQEFTRLPIDIITQGIASLFLVMYGVLHVAGTFSEIRATVGLEKKTWEDQRNIPSFYTFNHRGRMFNPNYCPQPVKSDLEDLE